MNLLVKLKSLLVNVPATGIKSVYFDLNQLINTEVDKTYPFVFWDLNTLKGVDNQRAGKVKLSITCYAVNKYINEEQTTDKITEWDALATNFKAYLDNLSTIETAYSAQMLNRSDIDFELFDRGIVSIDEEIAIAYKQIQIEVYC